MSCCSEEVEIKSKDWKKLIAGDGRILQTAVGKTGCVTTHHQYACEYLGEWCDEDKTFDVLVECKTCGIMCCEDCMKDEIHMRDCMGLAVCCEHDAPVACERLSECKTCGEQICQNCLVSHDCE